MKNEIILQKIIVIQFDYDISSSIRGSGSYLDGRKKYLFYLSEGMVKLQDWEMVMKYQRSNGSLFNFSATTAVAFIQLKDYGCLDYLHTLLIAFENAGIFQNQIVS